MSSLRNRRLWPPLPLLVIMSTALALAGCTGSHAIARYDGVGLPGMTWFAPAGASERTVLARWAAGVGPPVVQTARAGDLSADTLLVVSWNLRVVSSHLDNLVGARRGWIFGGESARTRQARALVEYLQGSDAVVLCIGDSSIADW